MSIQPCDILWFSDGQVKMDVPVDHFPALGRFCDYFRPKYIINGGDHWDLPSIGLYARHTREGEGMRLIDDIKAGNDALAAFDKECHKSKSYKPIKYFLKGNHEYRIDRLTMESPWLYEAIGDHWLEAPGWIRRRFLVVQTIQGVMFTHYLKSQGSNRALGGTIQNRLNKAKGSFVQGHEQQLMYQRIPKPDGSACSGIVCGSFHAHDEDYLGPQMSGHFRGCVLLRNVKNGDFDPEFWSIERLLAEFG